MHRKKAGAERVSESAAIEMAKVLEELGLEIGKEALDLTIHAGRNSIKGKDIKITANKVLRKP